MIEKLLLEGRNKAPFKFIEAIELEEFTLGLAPPRFHRATVRYNAAKNYLQFEVDMNFQTSGFQCVVSALARPVTCDAVSVSQSLFRACEHPRISTVSHM